MNAVDTNVLIYVRDPRDPVKQQRAVQLTTRLSDGVLLWQVACEFVAASRKLASFGFTQAQAWHEVARLRAMEIDFAVRKRPNPRRTIDGNAQRFILGCDDRRGVRARQCHTSLHRRF